MFTNFLVDLPFYFLTTGVAGIAEIWFPAYNLFLAVSAMGDFHDL